MRNDEHMVESCVIKASSRLDAMIRVNSERKEVHSCILPKITDKFDLLKTPKNDNVLLDRN